MPPILTYILNRVGVYLLSVWGSFSLAFVFFRLIPGDPIATYVASMEQQYSRQIEGGQAMVEAYREMFGLNGSLWEQYIRYLRNVFLSFDLGPSIMAFPTPALELITKALPWSIGLLGVSVFIGWALGFVVGGLAGFRRDGLVSSTLTNLALVISQIPTYFLALALLFTLGFGLSLLPTRGAFGANLRPAFSAAFLYSVVRHAMLPGLSVVLVVVAGWLLSTRSLVTTILGDDYLVFAEAKGLKKSYMLGRYVLRNAMLPQVTGLALSLGFVMNGFYLVEFVFSYPGIGTLLIGAIGQLDYNVMQGIVLMSIVVVLTATLLIDLLLPLVDPRVRVGGN